MQIFDSLIFFFPKLLWEFSFVKTRNISLEVTVYREQFYLDVQIIF